MFKPIERDVYSWEVPDAEFGEMMNGHLYIQDDGFVLIDPPLMPGLLQGLGVFGKCDGVILLSGSHKRGSVMASNALGTILYVPEFAAGQIQGKNVKSYKDGEKLAGDFKAIELETKIGVFGDHPIHEMALLDSKNRIFICDACYGQPGGSLSIAPEGIIPGNTRQQALASLKAIVKVLPTGVNTAFFGHGTDIKGEFSKQVETRKKEFNL